MFFERTVHIANPEWKKRFRIGREERREERRRHHSRHLNLARKRAIVESQQSAMVYATHSQPHTLEQLCCVREKIYSESNVTSSNEEGLVYVVGIISFVHVVLLD